MSVISDLTDKNGAAACPTRVAYVCTNFNGAKDTIAAVRSLREGDGASCDVVVVDNASEAQDLELLRENLGQDERVTILASSQNLGYFAGLNAGLRELQVGGHDYDAVVAGNNDLIFPTDFVASIGEIDDVLSKYSVISPSIVTVDGEYQNPHVIHGISRFRERVYDLVHASYWAAVCIRKLAGILKPLVRRGDEDRHDEAMEIVQGHGSCYLLSRRFFAEFGELWAPTFLFGEEFFLSLQLQERGQQVFYDPRVTVTHSWHSTLNTIPSKRQWELAREAHLVYRKHNPI